MSTLSSKLAVALLAGVFSALLIFFSASSPPQCAVRSVSDLLRGSPGRSGGSGSAVGEKNDLGLAPPASNLVAESPPSVAEQVYAKEPTKDTNTGEEAAATNPAPPPRMKMKPICDLSDPRYDVCEMWGDARTATDTNRSSTVFFIPPPSQIAAADTATWSIPAQSRKIIVDGKVLVRSLNQSNIRDAPNCTVRRSVPAVVFAIGGVTWNYWHAFTDVFVPLFTTARDFGGEVDLLTIDTKGRGWFYSKYRRLLGALSRYEVVDLDVDTEVRCYQHLVVGLRSYWDFDIDPARAPNHYDMFAFRTFVRETYSLPPPTAALPWKSGGGDVKRKPRAMIILRGHSRRFVNADAIVAAMEGAGFDVVRMEPSYGIDLDDLSRQVDACDVLVGAHGAGLTNMLFLRTGAVVVQVVPWGHMEPYCDRYFGSPASHMGFRYVAYGITAEESTLYDKYGKDSPVITDPGQFNPDVYDTYYWKEQNIRLNTTRFMPTLEKVKRMLQE